MAGLVVDEVLPFSRLVEAVKKKTVVVQERDQSVILLVFDPSLARELAKLDGVKGPMYEVPFRYLVFKVK